MVPTRAIWRRLGAALLKLANAVAAASLFVAPGLIDNLAERSRRAPQPSSRSSDGEGARQAPRG